MVKKGYFIFLTAVVLFLAFALTTAMADGGSNPSYDPNSNLVEGQDMGVSGWEILNTPIEVIQPPPPIPSQKPDKKRDVNTTRTETPPAKKAVQKTRTAPKKPTPSVKIAEEKEETIPEIFKKVTPDSDSVTVNVTVPEGVEVNIKVATTPPPAPKKSRNEIERERRLISSLRSQMREETKKAKREMATLRKAKEIVKNSGHSTTLAKMLAKEIARREESVSLLKEVSGGKSQVDEIDLQNESALFSGEYLSPQANEKRPFAFFYKKRGAKKRKTDLRPNISGLVGWTGKLAGKITGVVAGLPGINKVLR